MNEARRKDKIAIIGAGSVYTPELVELFFKDNCRLVSFDRLTLMDIDPRRLKILGGLTRRMALRQGVQAEIVETTSLEAAVKGASFVIIQMRVGGNQARLIDETIPLKYGVLGQETTGPGGMFKALRTIPELVKVAKAVKKHAPDAWILNFTNPSGLVTEAILKAVPEAKVLGICSIQTGREGYVTGILDAPKERVRVRSAGLNHLAWIYRIFVDGRDATDEFFSKLSPKHNHRAEFLKTLRLIPLGYPDHYYFPDEDVKWARKRGPRARRVLQIEKILMKRFADPSLAEKPKELELRGGSGYSLTMTTFIRALQGVEPVVLPVNVQNRGAVSGFAPDQVLEIETRIDPTGLTPLRVPDGELCEHMLGLMHSVKAYETLTAEAALTGCYRTALNAMIAHPLVPSYSIARKMLDEMLKAHKKHLPQF